MPASQEPKEDVMPYLRAKWSFPLLLAFALIAGACCAAAQTDAPQGNTPIGPVRISGGLMMGLVMRKVEPIWPDPASSPGSAGLIVLHVIIGKDGVVRSV